MVLQDKPGTTVGWTGTRLHFFKIEIIRIFLKKFRVKLKNYSDVLIPISSHQALFFSLILLFSKTRKLAGYASKFHPILQ